MRRESCRSPITQGWLVTAAVVLVTAGMPVSPAAADEWTFRTGLHADVWSGAGQNGHEVLAPFSLGFDTPNWGASIRSAYGNSERDPGSNPSGSITGFTDTTLSGYGRLRLAGAEIRAGLDLDLPTGVSRLRPDQLAAIQDDDLVLLRRFGEGLDVNVTLGAYRNFGLFGAGLGVGYLHSGEFDPTTDADDTISPGNELTVAALGDAYVTDTIRMMLRVAFTTFDADERRGQKVFREGDEFDILLTTEWRPEPWWVVLALRDVIRQKAERINAASQIVPELRNSNGNELRAGLTVGYILTDAWAVRAMLDVVHVEANDFPAGDPLHDGGRTKVAFGPGVTWTPTRTLGVDAGIRYFIMDVKESPFFRQAGTINGVHIDVRVTFRF